jgi:uncharacterized RDD family membrane protein YckC
VDQDVLVLTPEKTILSYRLASLGPRVLGHIVDLILVVAILIAVSVILIQLALFDRYMAMGVLAVVYFARPFAYFILFEGLWNGLTPGKKAVSVRVRMSDGTPITFAAALGRNLLRPADMLPGIYLVGILAIFTNPRGQRIGDLVANTIVLEDLAPKPNFAIAPHSVGFHPLETIVGDLRGMTIPEYNALRRFADRFPELPPSVQQKLVQEVWMPFALRRQVPPAKDVHPIYLAEAVVMKYGREHGLL